jgi:hypothetical protein
VNPAATIRSHAVTRNAAMRRTLRVIRPAIFSCPSVVIDDA